MKINVLRPSVVILLQNSVSVKDLSKEDANCNFVIMQYNGTSAEHWATWWMKQTHFKRCIKTEELSKEHKCCWMEKPRLQHGSPLLLLNDTIYLHHSCADNRRQVSPWIPHSQIKKVMNTFWETLCHMMVYNRKVRRKCYYPTWVLICIHQQNIMTMNLWQQLISPNDIETSYLAHPSSIISGFPAGCQNRHLR